MKELVEATNIRNEIQKLDAQLNTLKGYADKVLDKQCKVKFSFAFDIEEETTQIPHQDEVRQIEAQDLCFFMNGIKYVPVQSVDGSIFMEDSEFLVMIGALISRKEQVRQKYIDQFNQLNIKLKYESK